MLRVVRMLRVVCMTDVACMLRAVRGASPPTGGAAAAPRAPRAARARRAHMYVIHQQRGLAAARAARQRPRLAAPCHDMAAADRAHKVRCTSNKHR